jgi:hypothetical protein
LDCRWFVGVEFIQQVQNLYNRIDLDNNILYICSMKNLMSTSHKVAASVIAFIVISMLGWGAATINSKVDEKVFLDHCYQNEKRFQKLEMDILEERQTSREIKLFMHQINAKLERIDERTEQMQNRQ